MNRTRNTVYRGERAQSGLALVTADDVPLSPAPSQKVRNHSPDGFEWGYSGSGPAQLALAILLDVTRDPDLAELSHQDFKRQFVAGWEAGWAVTADQVREWLSLTRTRAE